MSNKRRELCRLYFVNINGLSSTQEFLVCQDVLDSLLSSGVGIFGLSETNLDWLYGMPFATNAVRSPMTSTAPPFWRRLPVTSYPTAPTNQGVHARG
jgi:hypothetical protein